MKRLLPLLLLLAPSTAFAHAGAHGATLLSGFLHPLGGLDHILAMLASGLLAGVTGGRAVWTMPVTFLAALLAGAGLGASGIMMPAVEPMILASIVLLGAVVALRVHLPPVAILPVIAIFGIVHGHAHGTEGPASGFPGYAAGFTLATAGLHLAGLGLGRTFKGIPARLLGSGTAMGGLALAFV